MFILRWFATALSPLYQQRQQQKEKWKGQLEIEMPESAIKQNTIQSATLHSYSFVLFCFVDLDGMQEWSDGF